MAASTVLENVVVLAFVVTLPNAVPPPTAPEKVVVAVPLFVVKFLAPSTVELKAIAEFVVLAVTSLVSLTALA